jgi:hypothetical protein
VDRVAGRGLSGEASPADRSLGDLVGRGVARSVFGGAMQGDAAHDERDPEPFSIRGVLAQHEETDRAALAGSSESSNAKVARGRRRIASWSHT